MNIDTFLYGFIVPILSYILEERLHIDPSYMQPLISAILAVHGIVAIVTSPIVGHFADQSPSRKTPLLLSLAGCLGGTVLVACAPSLWVLFLGRVLQGMSGSAVWIVAFATVADTVGEEHMGKTIGLVNAFAMGGVIAGPMASGLLLQTVGYWGTWTAPFVVLIVDIIARLVMIENPNRTKPLSSGSASSASSTATSPDEGGQENRALLADAPDATTYQSLSNVAEASGQADNQGDLSTSSAFYRTILTNKRVVTALLTMIAYGTVLASFEATLPLHVRDVFNWDSSTTGMMFFCLEIPSVFVGPLSGWLRDRVGIRIPATLSLVALAPLMWLLGVPGDGHFPWASADASGPAIYTACMLAIGSVAPFLTGGGVLELTCEYFPPPLSFFYFSKCTADSSTAVVKEYQDQNPNIFGPHGGYSRAYSVTDVAAALSMTAGPIVSGLLRQTIGYYYMNLIFGMHLP